MNFEPSFASSLPTTHALLTASNLTLHPAVSRVVLHGSRGLAGGYRSNSDIDLSLLVDIPPDASPSDRERLLREVWDVTCAHWQAPVELDLAVVFDARGCGLTCFERARWDEAVCTIGSVDCFGLYKLHKGFMGLVTNAGVAGRRMYPCLTIWRRDRRLPDL